MLCKRISNITAKICPDTPFWYLCNGVPCVGFGWDLCGVELIHCSFFLWENAHISTRSWSNCDISLQLYLHTWGVTFPSLHSWKLLMRCTHVKFWQNTIFDFKNFVSCSKRPSRYAQLPYIHPWISHKFLKMSCEIKYDIVVEVQPDVSQSHNVQLMCSTTMHW